MLSFEASRTGDIIPLMDGRALISRFDPSREAERFVRSSIQGSFQSSGTILIVGDLLGYLSRAVRRTFPEARIVSLSLHSDLMPENLSGDAREIYWSPASVPLETILTGCIDEEILLVQGFALLEWQPSINAFSDTASEVLAKIQRRIRILNGNITTIKAFGFRWIRNSISNFLFPQNFCRISESRGPFLIAASGPSLNRDGEYIRNSRAVLIALPSSLSFLRNLGRIPDIIIQTDPGYYASLHLSEAQGMKVPLAAPLFTDTCIRRHMGPVLPVSCGEPFEEALWSLLEIEPLNIPAMGTVAASAIFFSLGLSREPIIIAGLDLCYDDIHPHVRPHSFDPAFSADVCRTRPLYSRKYRYSRDTAPEQGQSPSLRTYSDWFAGLGEETARRILRLNPSRISLPFPPVQAPDPEEISGSEGRLSFREISVPSFRLRKNRLLQLLDDSRRMASRDPSSPLFRELRLKLCPPGIEADPDEYTAGKILELREIVSSMEET
ncbi:6-hydroxymethylpterin diphosphokinase MptE-like protein [Marispirochaeta aestuarii]|uniref:6-hydroxymethylpterin diphosphokinase MptE-like protein n=1 Tax=Marispirochaeta aestuarii TaxID=1963862 RepID=UPI002ABE10C3|nr:6-hydroxymethylpterin diphosphokinase MptE-like protein [Marispirochaeta aestuarii]